jgi:hypothetical protein
MSGDPSAGAQPGAGGFSRGSYQYQSQIDPEELFRTIFGDAFKKGRDFESMFDNYDNSGYSQQNEISQVNGST